MKFSHRTYDVNDLVHVIQHILERDLNFYNVQTSDKFDLDLKMDSLTKRKIITAIEYVLNYKLLDDDRKKINSIHDVLVCYKSALDKDILKSNQNKFKNV